MKLIRHTLRLLVSAIGVALVCWLTGEWSNGLLIVVAMWVLATNWQVQDIADKLEGGDK